MFLGVIADDFSGATDIASFLVKNGLSTVQLNGVSDFTPPQGLQSVVISSKSRSCAPSEAIELSLNALRLCKKIGCTHFFFKYCSTFDSTEKGNIGPVTDALLKELGEDFTVICPALPVNGRTIYNGYLFVGNVPMQESGMRNHPLNPMRDSNLMRLMDAQAAGKSGNVSTTIVEAGADSIMAHFAKLKEQKISYAVLDALNDSHLDNIAEALMHMPLVTGGSGLGGALARQYVKRTKSTSYASSLGNPVGGKAVVFSGSCSEMTNKQVNVYKEKAPFYQVSVERSLGDAAAYAKEIAKKIIETPANTLAPLICATVPPDELAKIHATHGLKASQALEQFFAHLAENLYNANYDHFIVAGGETSSIVSQALKVTGFYIGDEVASGVPWVRSLETEGQNTKPVCLVLKSGNFGEEDFFCDALKHIPNN